MKLKQCGRIMCGLIYNHCMHLTPSAQVMLDVMRQYELITQE